mmetsp:Transcript_19777/g.40848  ORF Transcript_19777/g.40848 Transcript_19777/m.40848 type:complete len:299 (+) Transcript_19777:1129-2025(+)
MVGRFATTGERVGTAAGAASGASVGGRGGHSGHSRSIPLAFSECCGTYDAGSSQPLAETAQWYIPVDGSLQAPSKTSSHRQPSNQASFGKRASSHRSVFMSHSVSSQTHRMSLQSLSSLSVRGAQYEKKVGKPVSKFSWMPQADPTDSKRKSNKHESALLVHSIASPEDLHSPQFLVSSIEQERDFCRRISEEAKVVVADGQSVDSSAQETMSVLLKQAPTGEEPPPLVPSLLSLVFVSSPLLASSHKVHLKVALSDSRKALADIHPCVVGQSAGPTAQKAFSGPNVSLLLAEALRVS